METEDVRVESTKKGLVLQLEVPHNSLEKALTEGVRASLMAGAIGYLVEKMTPDVVEKFATDLVFESLKSLDGWKIRTEIEKVISPMVIEAVNRPETKQFMREKVEEGISQAIADLPKVVKDKLIERAILGMTKAWDR
jgi:hypothetical protein